METITDHPVGFGELAGPLVHGAALFDWQIRSTQAFVAAFDRPFEEQLAEGRIPYAPVAVATSVERYPAMGDAVTVETVPLRVGDSSVELRYECTDGDGGRFATARMTHVTISPDGDAQSLPAEARESLAEVLVDDDRAVGPRAGDDTTEGEAAGTGEGTVGTDGGDGLPSFSSTFRVRSPHIEGAELAYFEEYPRFADVALEEFLEGRGASLAALSGERQPYRVRDWRWRFRSPVPFESTLEVSCDVRSVTSDTVRVGHEFTCDGRTSIEGVTEYGCFDRAGHPVPFDDAMLAPLRG